MGAKMKSHRPSACSAVVPSSIVPGARAAPAATTATSTTSTSMSVFVWWRPLVSPEKARFLMAKTSEFCQNSEVLLKEKQAASR